VVPPLDTLGQNVGTIRPGDVIYLTVFQTPELSGEFLVDARGILELPGIGPVRVAGLRVFELHPHLEKAMLGFVDKPSFTATVAIRVYVLGQVGQPGVQQVPPGTTLLAMLAKVGGETPKADLRRTIILRDQQQYVIDLEAGKLGGHQGRYNLISNDFVTVPEKRGFTRETLGFILSGVTGVITLVNLIVSVNR
jgi:polysaccharide export outer membrane protein